MKFSAPYPESIRFTVMTCPRPCQLGKSPIFAKTAWSLCGKALPEDRPAEADAVSLVNRQS